MQHNAVTACAQSVHRQRTVPVAHAVNPFTGRAALLSLSAATLVLVISAMPGHALGFQAPQGCTLKYTTQNRGCTVNQYYICEAEPAGDQNSASYDAEGLYHLSRIDSETRWIESQSLRSGLVDQLVEDSADHASFSTLLETGSDEFDFWTQSSNGERLRHIGRDELTGKSVTIDGVALEETRFELKTYDVNGELLIERTGNQFISRTERRFYGGIESQRDWTGQNYDSDDSPVTFSFPGDPGFGELDPQYDCDMLTTQLLRPQDAS